MNWKGCALSGGANQRRFPNPDPNPDPWLLNESEINRLRHSVEDYNNATFQVIPISGFRFTVITYPHAYPYPQVIKWSQYRRRRTTSLALMNILHYKPQKVSQDAITLGLHVYM